jgi:hypothetical protein
MVSFTSLHNADCNCALCAADRVAPSPLEIAIACARIRAGWSKSERISRIVDDATRQSLRGWRLPVIEGGSVLERLVAENA